MATKHDKPKVGEEPARQDAPPAVMALDLDDLHIFGETKIEGAHFLGEKAVELLDQVANFAAHAGRFGNPMSVIESVGEELFDEFAVEGLFGGAVVAQPVEQRQTGLRRFWIQIREVF